jgi:hypothetical protein
MKWLTKIGLVFIALGVLIPASIDGYYKRYVNWNPVEHPISSLSGTVEQTFRVNFASMYYGNLDFDNQVISTERLECLIGLHRFSPEPDCRGEKVLLHFSWRLMHDGKLASSGTYVPGNGDLSRDEVEANFLSFAAKHGDTFTLLVNFDPDASVHALDTAHPVLRVSASPARLETAQILEQLSLLAGVAMGGVGLVFIVGDVFFNRRAVRA